METRTYPLTTNVYLLSTDYALYSGFKNGQEIQSYFSQQNKNKNINKIDIASITSILVHENDRRCFIYYNDKTNTNRSLFVQFANNEDNIWKFVQQLSFECRFEEKETKENTVTSILPGIFFVLLSLALGFFIYGWAESFFEKGGHIKTVALLFYKIAIGIGHIGCVVTGIIIALLIAYFSIYKKLKNPPSIYIYSKK